MPRMSRRLVLCAALAAPLAIASPPTRAADTIKVAASFTVLGDMVKQIGGDRVEVKIFVGPNGDAHVYEPASTVITTPCDGEEPVGSISPFLDHSSRPSCSLSAS